MAVNNANSAITLRAMTEDDCQSISSAFTAQGWDKPVSQYAGYFMEQQDGKRDVLIAEYKSIFAGYVTIVWETKYAHFRDKGIPEIMDLNVLIKYRRQGIASRLMDEAEKRISQRSKYSGLGVGLYRDYGNAQIMYAQRGYVPDGKGICYDDRELEPGDNVKLDDGLCLMMIKEL
jgi:ribosomal protein S18 acetylase RimI-like enzyme